MLACVTILCYIANLYLTLYMKKTQWYSMAGLLTSHVSCCQNETTYRCAAFCVWFLVVVFVVRCRCNLRRVPHGLSSKFVDKSPLLQHGLLYRVQYGLSLDNKFRLVVIW